MPLSFASEGYFVHQGHFEIIFQLNKAPVDASEDPSTSAGPGGDGEEEKKEDENVPSDIFAYYEKIDKEDEEGEEKETVSFEVKQENIEILQKR